MVFWIFEIIQKIFFSMPLKKLYQAFRFALASPSSISTFLNVILLRCPGEISLRFYRPKRSSFPSGIFTFPSSVVAWCKNWLILISTKNVISNGNVGIRIFSLTKEWTQKYYLEFHTSKNNLQLLSMHSRKQPCPNSFSKFFIYLNW